MVSQHHSRRTPTHEDLRDGGKRDAKATSHRSGYQHSWHDYTGVQHRTLATFPSDDEITVDILPNALDEAQQLLRACGMLSLPSSGRSSKSPITSSYLEPIRTRCNGEDAITDLVEDLQDLQGSHDVLEEKDEIGCQLDSILHEDSNTGLRDFKTDDTLAGLGVSAAASAMADISFIDDLAEVDEELFAQWRDSAQSFLVQLQAFQAKPVPTRPPAPALSRATDTLTNASPIPVVHTVLPNHRRPKLLLYVNQATKGYLNHDVLIQERQRHETREAAASVSWRYRNSALVSTAGSVPPTTVDSPRQGLKAKLVNEIVRVQTAYDEAREARIGTGVERAVRWGKLKRGAVSNVAGSTVPLVEDASQTIGKLRREAFSDVVLPWRFSDAGVSSCHPLHAGSVVLAAYNDEVYLCIVRVLYEKGGGKTLTHNFVEACTSVDKLTRFVAQVFVPYGGIYTPLVATLPGYQHPSPSFLYLHSQSLILALDYQYQEPLISGRIPAGQMYLLTPSSNLTSLLDTAAPFYGDIASAIRSLQEASRKRKREVTGGISQEVVTKKR